MADEKVILTQDEIARLVEQLRPIYNEKNIGADFDDEHDTIAGILPLVQKKLSPWRLKSPFAVGSTATLWLVEEPATSKTRALKLPRPKEGRIGSIIQVIRDEGTRLASLSHFNIIKVYFADEVRTKQHSFPFFVMEHFHDVADFDRFIIDNIAILTGDDIIRYFHDVLNGLSVLHASGIVHCDIKPANLLIAEGRALVADLGYAKNLPLLTPSGLSDTTLHFTEEYAHPTLRKLMRRTSDVNAAEATLNKGDLRKSFDLFSLGRTFQKVLGEVRRREDELRLESRLTPYQWRYLALIAVRLLDGVVDRTSRNDIFTSDVPPGWPETYVFELKYAEASDALEDCERLLNLVSLEGQIPELNTSERKYTQIPDCRPAFPSRVRRITDHLYVARLRQVTQLGFVSLVYPGGGHSRFEHAMGAFTRACEAVRGLWYDQDNCLFRSIMSMKDIEAALVASLLHDIGQYPMAHDLAEVSEEFDHENFTEFMLRRADPETGESVADVLWMEWRLRVDAVLAILRANSKSPLRERLLKSIVSGPLDADKVDYLRRDTRHLGVTFGDAIDTERLYRNLTVALEESTLRGPSTVAQVGVYDRGIAVADQVWKVRREMFRQVYWQHTVRSFKAMLTFVVRNIRIRLRVKPTDWSAFLLKLSDFVTAPMSVYFNPIASMEPSEREGLAAVGASVLREDLRLAWAISSLSGADDAVMCLFWRHANEAERTVLQMIRRRKPFKRLFELDSKGAGATLYGDFKTYRMNDQLEIIEQRRFSAENAFVAAVSDSFVSDEAQSKWQAAEGLIRPVLLIDVPIKAVKRPKLENVNAAQHREALYVARQEEYSNPADVGFPPAFPDEGIQIEQTEFDQSVGKVRILVHPAWYPLARRLRREHKLDALLGHI